MKLDENKQWVNDNGEKIKWLNNKEGAVIGNYIAFLGNKIFEKTLQKLYFADGTIVVGELNGYGEADNDKEYLAPDYEEFCEFYFTIKKVVQKAKDCKWKRNQLIYFNGGKKLKNFAYKQIYKQRLRQSGIGTDTLFLRIKK